MAKKKKGKKASAPKAARPMLVKGGNVVPFARKSAPPVCWNGHTGKRGQRCCTACGEPFGISQMAHEDRVLKASGVTPTGYWAEQMRRESDPAQQEVLRAMAQKAAGGPPSAEAIARAWGYSSLPEAAMHCTAPEARTYFMNAWFGNNGGAA